MACIMYVLKNNVHNADGVGEKPAPKVHKTPFGALRKTLLNHASFQTPKD